MTILGKIPSWFSKIVTAVSTYVTIDPSKTELLKQAAQSPSAQILLAFTGVGLLATSCWEVYSEQAQEKNLDELLELIRRQVPLRAGLQLAAEEAAVNSGQKLEVPLDDARFPFVVLFNLLVDLQRGQIQSHEFEKQALDLFSRNEQWQIQFATFIQKEFNGIRQLIEGLPQEFEVLRRELDFTRDDVVDLARQLQSQSDQLSRVLENTAHFPPTRLPFDSYNSEKDRDSATRRYLYSKRRVPFLGRRNDWEKMWEFLRSSQSPEAENFVWWLWTGPGGTGKSRIAYELALAARIAGWQAGFLDRMRRFDAWDRWEPDRPTLLIIDYVAERAKENGAIIAQLWEQRHRWRYPVRVLLLERAWSEHAPWWREFCQRESSSLVAAIESSQYAPPHTVGPLGETELRQIMELIFAESGKTIPNVPKVSEALANIDAQPRPLIAALLADELLRTPEEDHRWDVKLLVESILRREVARWKKLGIDEKHLNLLTWATLIGPVSASQSDALAVKGIPVPSLGEFSEEQVEMLGSFTGIDNHKVLPSLQPDMLGECFVLERLGGNLELAVGKLNQISLRKVTTELIHAGWEHQPTATGSFMGRAFENFPQHQQLDVFLDPPTGTHALGYWAVSAANAYSKSIRTQDGTAVGVNDEIRKRLWGGLWSFSNAIPHIVAAAIYNRAISYHQHGLMDEAIHEYTNCLEFPGSSCELRAISLSNRGSALISDSQYEDAIISLKQCLDMTGVGRPVVALALVNLSAAKLRLGRIDEAFADLTTCLELQGIPCEIAAMALSARGRILARQQSIQIAIDDFTRCINLGGSPVNYVAESLICRGDLRRILGEVDEALGDYLECVSLSGASADQVARAKMGVAATGCR